MVRARRSSSGCLARSSYRCCLPWWPGRGVAAVRVHGLGCSRDCTVHFLLWVGRMANWQLSDSRDACGLGIESAITSQKWKLVLTRISTA